MKTTQAERDGARTPQPDGFDGMRWRARTFAPKAADHIDELLGLLREIGPILNADDPDAASHSYSGYTAWQSRVNAILADQEKP